MKTHCELQEVFIGLGKTPKSFRITSIVTECNNMPSYPEKATENGRKIQIGKTTKGNFVVRKVAYKFKGIYNTGNGDENKKVAWFCVNKLADLKKILKPTKIEEKKALNMVQDYMKPVKLPEDAHDL